MGERGGQEVDVVGGSWRADGKGLGNRASVNGCASGSGFADGGSVNAEPSYVR